MERIYNWKTIPIKEKGRVATKARYGSPVKAPGTRPSKKIGKKIGPQEALEPGPRRRSDGVRRRAELLDAAEQAFERLGLLGVGIEDIRREAGASPSSVYHQFAGIGDILLALLLRIFESLFTRLAERVGRARSAEGVVRALVDGHIEWIAAHPRQGRIMYQAMTLEVGGLSEEARQTLERHKAELIQPIVDRFAPFVAKGELPAWSPKLLDVVLLGVAHEALRRWLGGETELAPELLRKLLPTLAWKSIRK